MSRHAKAGAPEHWKDIRECQFSYLKAVVKIKASHKFLDIGCGTLRGGIPVIDYLDVGNYYGIDIQKNVLEEARAEVVDERLQFKKPNLIHFNCFDTLEINAEFNVMWSWLSMWYLNEEELEKCFRFVKNNLANDGVFYFNTGLISGKESVIYGKPKSWYGFSSWYRPFKYFEKLALKNDFSIKNLGSPLSVGFGSRALQETQKPMLKVEKKN